MDGPLPKLCPAVALSHQDGHHSAVALLLKAALIQVSDYRLLGAYGFHCFSVIFYMCNCYWYTSINVHALFHMYMCYIYYIIPRRRLHKLVELVSYPFCLYEQIKLL